MTEDPGVLPSMRSQRVRHNLATEQQHMVSSLKAFIEVQLLMQPFFYSLTLEIYRCN